VVAGDCLVPSTMGIMQQLGARATLIVVNVICLIFSCILIFYGTTGMGARTPAGAGLTCVRPAVCARLRAPRTRGVCPRAEAWRAGFPPHRQRALHACGRRPRPTAAAAARRPRLPRDAHGCHATPTAAAAAAALRESLT